MPQPQDSLMTKDVSSRIVRGVRFGLAIRSTNMFAAVSPICFTGCEIKVSRG